MLSVPALVLLSILVLLLPSAVSLVAATAVPASMIIRVDIVVVVDATRSSTLLCAGTVARLRVVALLSALAVLMV